MPFLSKPKLFLFTHHARAKMGFYKLSEARVRRVLNAPKRTEEGVAPKTFAVMQPVSSRFVTSKDVVVSRGATPKRKETWNQEIWVMYQDSAKERVIISAWRYPGVTKIRGEVVINLMQKEYNEYNHS